MRVWVGEDDVRGHRFIHGVCLYSEVFYGMVPLSWWCGLRYNENQVTEVGDDSM